MSRAVVVVLALVILAVGGVYATEAALEDSADSTEINGEEWTPNAGSVTQLDHSNIDGAYYTHKVEVQDEGNVDVEEGDDYEWFVSNGTIYTVPGGDLDGDTSATINYSYRVPSDEAVGFAGALSNIPQALGLLLPAGLVVLFFAFIRG